MVASLSSWDIFRSLSVPKLATASSANFAANVVEFVPKLIPFVSILVENVPTPDTLMFGDAIPVPVVVNFWFPLKYNWTPPVAKFA